MKLVLTGGGTAGHVMPHLALLNDFKKHFSEIIYIGSKNGIEKELIEKENIPYYSTTTTKFKRDKIFSNLAIPINLAKGIAEAKKILKEQKPDVVFSKGGFVSLPTVIAAHKLKIPIVIHESDLSCGLANKIASKYANTVCTTFAQTAKHFKGKGVCSGSPIRKTQGTFENPFANNKPILTITGGSQGAMFINKIVRDCLDELLTKFNVYHICGKGNLCGETKDCYKEVEFDNNILNVFKNSSLVISRAGSNTIFELFSLQVPSILIPLPKGNSRGDQEENAKYFKQKGFANVLSQSDLSKQTLLSAIKETLEKRSEYITNMQSAYIPNTNEIILNEILKQVKAK